MQVSFVPIVNMIRRPLLTSAAEIAVILCMAAIAHGDEHKLDSAIHEQPISDLDRQHWAFRPLVRPDVPAPGLACTGDHPVDRFLGRALDEAGLAPLAEADRFALIRRVTFDLTGLPPTLAEVDAFVADNSPAAYEQLVDRLLTSNAYGQRWAQHWLDLARFAESDGFEHDNARKDAWRYRDWVIDALNDDMPYDQFVRRQLAGDELYPDETGSAATGFLACGPDMPDINLQEERRHAFLNDLTGTVGAVFLGLQVGCAACHDHKYDPISQADFYRLRAIFEPAFEFRRDKQLPIDVHEESSEVPPSRLMIRGDFRRAGPVIQPGFPRIADPFEKSPLQTPASPSSSGRRAALAAWLTRPNHPLAPRVAVNRIWQHHFVHGLSRTPSDFGVMGSEPSHPKLLDWLATEFSRLGWSMKALHRLLVTSAAYRRASYVDVESKEESAERQAWKKLIGADPDNELLARMNRRRLEGEAIRDFLLAATDRLSPRRGGPGVMPPLPAELLSTIRKDHWKVSPDEEDHRRRSIYLFVRRNLRYPLFDAFDRPDTNASCPRRGQSTTAPQALWLLNSETSLAAARHLAGLALSVELLTADDRIALIYRKTLARRPTKEETSDIRRFLTEQALCLGDPSHSDDELPLPHPLPSGIQRHEAAAWTLCCLAVLNLNEFIYID